MSLPSTASAPAHGIDVDSLYAAHWRSMVRLAVLLVDDVASAEDVVQDAFLALHRNQDRIRVPEAAVGYVRAAVVNGARSQLRHRGVARRGLARLHVVSGHDMAQGPEGPDAGLEAGADAEMLAAVRTLPRRMQEVLVLRYWADLSEAQIAATLGISPGAVKSTASRGIDKLRTTLGGVR